MIGCMKKYKPVKKSMLSKGRVRAPFIITGQTAIIGIKLLCEIKGTQMSKLACRQRINLSVLSILRSRQHIPKTAARIPLIALVPQSSPPFHAFSSLAASSAGWLGIVSVLAVRGLVKAIDRGGRLTAAWGYGLTDMPYTASLLTLLPADR